MKVRMDGKYETQDKQWEVTRVICVDAPGAFPVVVVLRDRSSGDEFIGMRRADGGNFAVGEDPRDLIESKLEIRGKWLNVTPDRHGNFNVAAWDSQEQADRFASPDRVACIPVPPLSFREGDGL